MPDRGKREVKIDASRHLPAPGGRRPWGQVVVGVLLAALGLVSLVFLVHNLALDGSLWILGRRAAAEVDELWAERTSENTEGELTFRYYARYHFSTPQGQTIRGVTSLDVREWGALEVGGPLKIVYFPLYPAHNRLEESRFVPLLACAYLPFVVVVWALLGGAWYLLRPTTPRQWWFGPRQ